MAISVFLFFFFYFGMTFIPAHCLSSDCRPFFSMNRSRVDKNATRREWRARLETQDMTTANELDTNNIRVEIGIHMDAGPHPL